MKKLSNQEMKKIAKSTLALVLAGTFTFSPIAMAEENHSDIETVELQNVSPEEIEEAKSQVDELEETNPSLIPGDFFYFAKIALEKIRLAFTFDNAKEAELLATYAAERLQEAGALFAEGKEEEALNIIEAAVQYMETSQDIVDEEAPKEEDADSEEGTEVEEGTTSDEEAEETAPEESTEEGEEPADEADAEEPSEEADGSEEEVGTEDPFQQIEGMLRQNIIALKATMEHVGNENARNQLQKNIDKTYEKMAKKLAKLEEKYAEKPVEEEEIAEPVELEPIVEPDLLPADDTPVVEEHVDETMPVNDEATVVPAAAPKAEKEKAKQERKAQKAAEKQERKEAQQQKKEEKQQSKKDKNEEKKANNNENKGNGNGKGHGQGNGKGHGQGNGKGNDKN